MNDFDGLLARVIEQARGLQIPISERIDPHVRVNRRAVTRFGCCVKQGERYTIELSERLLQASGPVCRLWHMRFCIPAGGAATMGSGGRVTRSG